MRNLTFTQIAERWLNESAGSVTPKTIAHYRWLLERYVYPEVGDSIGITEEDVRKLVEEKRARGLSESTVYSLPKLIWRILSYASAEGLCEPPSWDLTIGTPERVNPVVILTPAEAERLSAWLTAHPDGKNLCLLLMLSCGIGIGEVLQLRWEDVSVRKGEIRIRMERDPEGSRRKRIRTVPIGEREKMCLRRLAGLPECCLSTGTARPMGRANLESRFRSVLREQALPPMTPTCLRHTWAVRAFEGGMDYGTVSRLLGVENSGTFRRFYRNLVSAETASRLEQERLEGRKVRQAPEHIDHPGPDLLPDVIRLREKVDARKKELQRTLDDLEGDLSIIRALRNSDGVQGQAREGFYSFVEKVLGDDRDGKVLVEYLRCNMRVASMPSRINRALTVQSIRRGVARGFAKLGARLDRIYAVEGYDLLPMFRSLCEKVAELAPPDPKRRGPKGKPSLEKDYRDALRALERLRQERQNTDFLDPEA